MEIKNLMECGKCGHYDGSCCTIDDCDRYVDEVVKDCGNFEYSIYYQI